VDCEQDSLVLKCIVYYTLQQSLALPNSLQRLFKLHMNNWGHIVIGTTMHLQGKDTFIILACIASASAFKLQTQKGNQSKSGCIRWNPPAGSDSSCVNCLLSPSPCRRTSDKMDVASKDPPKHFHHVETYTQTSNVVQQLSHAPGILSHSEDELRLFLHALQSANGTCCQVRWQGSAEAVA